MKEHYLFGKVKEIQSTDSVVIDKLERQRKIAIIANQMHEEIERETTLCKVRIYKKMDKLLEASL